jgi:hypothetical protein
MKIANIIIEKLLNLKFELKERDNQAYIFFDTILKELETIDKRNNAIEKLRNCYAISQYANFNYKEEQILDEILEIINNENTIS